MRRIREVGAAMLAVGMLAGPATASVITFNGKLNDSANTALVWSDLTPALFDNDNDIANNVALYTLHVPVAGTVALDSTGFAAGGLGPYFTVFTGTGNGATFLDSNFFTAGDDFHLSELLAAGDYTLALGVNQNMSFAENLGSGTLGDGFIQIGDPSQSGDWSYAFTATIPGSTTGAPEPASLLLLGIGAAAIRIVRKTRHR